MEFIAKLENVQVINNKVHITFEVDKSALPKVFKLKGFGDKLLSLVLTIFREKRSLDANAYMWVLCKKVADILNSSKEEIYIEMLKRYGVFTHGIFASEAVKRIKQEWRACIELGEVTVNGHTGIQLQLYYGSSTYDTKEMSVLINGIVDECKALEIETLPETEIKSLCEEWANEKQKDRSNSNKQKSETRSNRA